MEDISALVDDELRGRELDAGLRRLREPDAAARWARYHLISDSLHGHLGSPLAINEDLAGRVRTALAAEPVPLRRPRGRIASLPWRPAAAVAMAASVAGAAVLFVLERQEGPQAVAVAQQSPAPRTAPVQPRPDLSPYLVNHLEHSRSPGLHGMLPYVRIVSHE